MSSTAAKTIAPGLGESYTEGRIFGVPKWALGILIGGAVSLGLVYYVVSAPSNPKDKTTKGKKKKSKSSTATSVPPGKAGSKVNDVTIEDIPEDSHDDILDPLERAIAQKNKGNKYFKGGKYELAIKCYTDAIESCPPKKDTDLSTFYQNRAAAYDQLGKLDEVLKDCNEAINLNKRYVKALERRSKVLKQLVSSTKDPETGEVTQESVDNLRLAVEDMTSVCFLESFQKQDRLISMDVLLKELGKAEARLIFLQRKPVLGSFHAIHQYLVSFTQDPIMAAVKSQIKEDTDINELRGLKRALFCIKKHLYDQVLVACDEELAGSIPNGNGGDGPQENGHEHSDHNVGLTLLLRATFYILSKQQGKAMVELGRIIEDESFDVKIRVNALVKRASLFIQRCEHPGKDAELSFKDFAAAQDLDENNCDIYHHRGQMHLLTEQTEMAVEDLNKAVALNPDFPLTKAQKLFVEYKAAQAAQDTSKVKHCIAELEATSEEFPQCTETSALLAQILCDKGSFDKAEEYYIKGIKADPKNANILVHRGLVAIQSRSDFAEAREFFHKAIELDNKCEFAYETLATLEVQMGNVPDALKLFDKAIPLVNTELELGHICGLRSAALAQDKVSKSLGISIPSMM